jgi:hypothetical protein|nr:MAG TPA: Protein of unknown function (DUF1587) [Caudoviricetes sp.]
MRLLKEEMINSIKDLFGILAFGLFMLSVLFVLGYLIARVLIFIFN